MEADPPFPDAGLAAALGGAQVDQQHGALHQPDELSWGLAVQLGQDDGDDRGLLQLGQRGLAELTDDGPDVALGEQVALEGFEQGG